MSPANVEHHIIRSSQLSREDNYEYWRTGIASLFDATPTDSDFDTFSADLATYNPGQFLIGKSSASPQQFHRSGALVSATAVDHLLVQLYVKGECSYNADGGYGKGVTGDIVCFDLSRPMQSYASNMDIISLVIPRQMMRLMPKVVDNLHGARVEGSSTLGVILSDYMLSIARRAPTLSQTEGQLLVESTSALLSSAFTGAVTTQFDTLTHVNLQTIQTFIERNLTNLSLSTDMIMYQFGLSRSALYRLFEPVGGVGEYIRERRLKLARLKLASVGTGRGAVSKLAYSCGFSNEDTFSRAFQQYFGIRPSEAIRDIGAAAQLKNMLDGDADNWMHNWLDKLQMRQSSKVP